MQVRRKTRRKHPVNLGCVVSGLFLTASLFYLFMAYLHRDTVAVKHPSGPAISVDGVVSSSSSRHAVRRQAEIDPDDPDIVTVDEYIAVIHDFRKELHNRLSTQNVDNSDYLKVYQTYHNLTMERLYPFDLHYLQHMPPRRSDDSIFLSVASYRDENCVNTLTAAYEHAGNPQRLNVGLVQQNCMENCMSGVLANEEVVPIEPDEDCYDVFCATDLGQPHCDAGRVRVLKMSESDSMGPYLARFFASKLWNGESWFMQIDSHSTFSRRWDWESIQMLKAAESDKPVLTHYPPPAEDTNFVEERTSAAPRICGGVFSGDGIEAQIVRLEECEQYDKHQLKKPGRAPYIAAGYFVAHSGFLQEVPFDPFLPWIFMGEEVIMSARFWTHGYDIFSPVFSVIGHMYVRRHKPKYWESVGRFLWPGVDDRIQDLVINRVKHQLLYPESAPDLIRPKGVFTGLEHYTMGHVRRVEDYLEMAGLDPVRKEQLDISWCYEGRAPKYYNNNDRRKKQGDIGSPPPGMDQVEHR